MNHRLCNDALSIIEISDMWGWSHVMNLNGYEKNWLWLISRYCLFFGLVELKKTTGTLRLQARDADLCASCLV
jgi:hypothetical protein